MLLSGLVDDHDHAPLVETYSPPSTFKYNPDGFLTGASRARPRDIALNYLRGNAATFGLDALDLESPIISSQYTGDNGITYIYLTQEFNGLAVSNSQMNVAVMPDGQILSVGGGFVPGLGELERTVPAAVPQIDPRQALRGIADQVEVTDARGISITNRTSRLDRRQTLSAPDFSTSPVITNLQYTAMPDGSVQLGWKMILDLPSHEHWYDLTADATNAGRINYAVDYVAHASYNVLPSPTAHPHDPDPGTSPNRQIVTDPHIPSASPFGWHDTNGVAGPEFTITQGNNAQAYIDRDGSPNVPDPGSSPDGGAGLVFDHPLDLTLAPTGYQPAAVTNLFYWNNIIHDVTYKFGFTEVARNFQSNNYGNGGLGNDSVQAEAQDGSGTNNANFATPTDGSRPRMQMYLWTAPNPDRDGDVDNRIIVHEYTHGISNRLTGTGSGLSAIQSRGMGEGWGDFLSLLLTQDPADLQNGAYGVGTYALGQPNTGPGVRRFPYSYDVNVGPISWDAYGSGTGNLLNGGTITRSTAVHGTGEIWCSSLWDMTWNLVNKHGYAADLSTGYNPATGDDEGNLLAFRLVLDAMKLQPAQPSFTEARNAVLAADVALTGGANQLEIWQAFARRGLGVNASTPNSGSTAPVTLSFEIPVADPFINSHSPSGTIVTPASFMDFRFNQNMDQGSFSIVDDVVSFTGPGGVDLKPTISGFSWQPNNTLRVNFSSTAATGSYALTIGPNILAADNGNPMDADGDGVFGEIPDDQYTGSFSYVSVIGPDGFGYNSAEYPFEALNLVIGQPGVVTLLNGINNTPTGTITLPAGNSFNFYGVTYTQVFVSVNGLITFGSGNTASANGDLTTSPGQAAIAALWDDWDTSANGPGGTDSSVLYRIDGNRLIVEWSDVPHQTEANGAVTFQAILQLNTGATPGRAILNYPDVVTNDPAISSGASASVGIKDTGTQGARRLLLSLNNNSFGWVQNGKALLLATDVVAPQVTASSFNFLTSQSVTISFNDNVGASLDTSDLVLHNNTTNTDINAADLAVAYDGGTNTATFTFPGLGGILPDGDYTLTLLSSGVTDASGNPLDGDGNGTIGGNHTAAFFFINGDANRDRTVNLLDFNILSANFGLPGDFSDGDFDYSGIINIADFNILASRFGQSVGPDSLSASGSLRLGSMTTKNSSSGATTDLYGPGTSGVFGQVPIVPPRSDLEELAGL